MNINIVCDYASIYSGNFIYSILYFADSIRNHNKIVFSFPNEANGREWIGLIKSKWFKVYFFSRTKKEFLRDIKDITKKESTNFVYYHFVSPALGKTAFLFKRIKLCFHIHSDFSAGKKYSFLRRIKDYYFDRFVKRKSIYLYVSSDLFSKSCVPIKFYIPNGLVKNKLDAKSLTSYIKDEDGNLIDKNKYPIFLSFAWSPYIKGIDVLVQAFNDFSKTTKGFLVLVHAKDNGKNELINYLKFHHINNFKNIIFVPPIEDITNYYSCCSCFISASRSEGFSYSVLEAISLDKTVIVSNIPGTLWSQEFKSVIVFESENSHSLKIAMDKSIEYKMNEDDKKYNLLLIDKYTIEKWSNNVITSLKKGGIVLWKESFLNLEF